MTLIPSAMTPTVDLVVASYNMVFPSTGEQVLSLIIHLFGITILSFLLGMKVSRIQDLSVLYGGGQLNFPRMLILILIVDSWGFLFTSAIILHGVGAELRMAACLAAIYTCMGFYCVSKFIIYIFLAERIHIVWSPPTRGRLRSPVYLACAGAVSIYAAVVVLVIRSRIAYFRSTDHACITGIGRPGDIPLLVYYFFINVLFTSLFTWPLLKSKCRSAYIHDLTKRNLMAAAVALTTSCINILVLLVMHGEQLAWVCLGSCGTDIVVNAMVMYWVTSGPSSRSTVQIVPAQQAAGDEKPTQHDPRSLLVLTSLNDSGASAAAGSTSSKFALPLHLSFGSTTSESEGGSEPQTASFEQRAAQSTFPEFENGGISPGASERSRAHARSPSRMAMGVLTSLVRGTSVRGGESRVQDFQISITTTTEQEVDPPPGELPQ